MNVQKSLAYNIFILTWREQKNKVSNLKYLIKVPVLYLVYSNWVNVPSYFPPLHPCEHAILHEATVFLSCSQVPHAWSLYSRYKLSPAALHNTLLPLKQMHTHTQDTHANPCAFTLWEDMHWFSSSPHFLLSFSLALCTFLRRKYIIAIHHNIKE